MTMTFALLINLKAEDKLDLLAYGKNNAFINTLSNTLSTFDTIVNTQGVDKGVECLWYLTAVLLKALISHIFRVRYR